MVFKKYKKLIITGGVLLLLIGGLLFALNNHTGKTYKGLGMSPDLDVADNIVSAPGNKSFAGALYNLGYTTFLHGKGPFTVFVPLDSAYSHLLPDTKAYLADINNQGTIRQLILYHVVKGKYLSTDLKDGMELTTIEGEPLIIKLVNGNIVINGRAFVRTKDIVSKNGVIYTVDNFLFPPTMANLEAPFQ